MWLIPVRNGALSSRQIFLAPARWNRLTIALTDPEVRGIVIATPAASHFCLAQKALDAGKHVFVEKPLGHQNQ